MAKQNVALSLVSNKYDPDHDYTIKVSEVYVDWKWNTRVDVASTDPSSETDEAGYQETLISIAKDGQRSACVLRPNPYKGKAGHAGAKYEFMLVEGFGRTRAKCEIAAGEHDVALGGAGMVKTDVDALHTKEPTIKAKIIAMTEAEARKRNLGENMLRSQLTAPDIAYGVFKLAEAEPEASNKSLGEMIGRSEPYVAKLRRIYSAFEGVQVPAGKLWDGSPAMPVMQAWRCAPKKAMNEDMLAIADSKTPLTDSEKLEKYVAAISPPTKPVKIAGQKAFPRNACVDAENFGEVLGALQREGAISIEGLDSQHAFLVAAKYAGKAETKQDTEDARDAIIAACLKGIDKGSKVAKRKKPTKEEIAAAQAKLDAPAKERAAKKKASAKK